MVKKFKVVEIENKTSKNKKVSWKTIRVGEKDAKTKMKWKEVDKYYNKLIETGYTSEQISIAVMGVDYKTLKAFEDDDLKPWDDEEYYKDKVKYPTKFNEYFFVDFMIKSR